MPLVIGRPEAIVLWIISVEVIFPISLIVDIIDGYDVEVTTVGMLVGNLCLCTR